MTTSQNQFTVLQTAELAGRQFHLAQDRTTGQVVHLLIEPAGGSTPSLHRPCLPDLSLLQVEPNTRVLIGGIVEGETIETLVGKRSLEPDGALDALFAVLDGLEGLSSLRPPILPQNIDPAFVKRVSSGQWKLDYLMMAHTVGEDGFGKDRTASIRAFAMFLFWVMTGRDLRGAGATPLSGQHGLPTAVQFVIMRCLGGSYSRLSDVRTALKEATMQNAIRTAFYHPDEARSVDPETTGRLSAKTLAPLPEEELPDAAPAEPSNGKTRLFSALNWRLPAAIGLGIAVLAIPLSIMLGGGTPKARPVDTASPPSTENTVEASTPRTPEAREAPEPTAVTVAVTCVSPVLVDKPAECQAVLSGGEPNKAYGVTWALDGDGLLTPGPDNTSTFVGSQPGRVTVKVSVDGTSRSADASVVVEKRQVTANPPQRRPSPAAPPLPTPVCPEDAKTGAMRIVVYFNGQLQGTAYLFPHPQEPFISPCALAELFHQRVTWNRADSGVILLEMGGRETVLRDYEFVGNNLWLKFTTALQATVGIELESYRDSAMYFRSV